MKKIILNLFLISLAFSACSDGTKTVKTSASSKVTVEKDNETLTYNKVDSSSKIAWRATHLGGTSPRFGFIDPSQLEFLVNDDKLSNAKVIIDMNSLSVTSFPEGDDQKKDLTDHLKSSDFFNTAKYPTAKFELTKATKIEGKFNTSLTGNLTILDKTKSISFKANVTISPEYVAIMSEKFTVDRKDWGLIYHTEGTVGVPKDYLIADAIEFQIDVKAKK